MAGSGYNFSGIPTLDAQDPGQVASATVPSSKLADWLSQNIPSQFQPSLSEPSIAPQMDTPVPMAGPAQGPAWGGGNVFGGESQQNLTALRGEALQEPSAVPYTAGLLRADPIDAVVAALTGGIGAAGAGASAESGLLRNLLRYRLGSNPGQGFEKIAETLQQVAPAAMRPAQATAQGIADVLRTGAGKSVVQSARDAGENAIARELNQITAANQATAAQGLTGQYAARAAADVPDLAAKFKGLTQELADAGSSAYNRLTGQLRSGAGVLPSLRSREEIYQEIQSMLSPDQWQRFLDLQKEYASGSTLERLFEASRRGVDVLKNQSALQDKAKYMEKELARLSPEIIKSIFRGGSTLVGDTAASIPVGLFGSGIRAGLRIPGTVIAGAPSEFQQWLAALLGASTGAAGGLGAERIGQSYAP